VYIHLCIFLLISITHIHTYTHSHDLLQRLLTACQAIHTHSNDAFFLSTLLPNTHTHTHTHARVDLALAAGRPAAAAALLGSKGDAHTHTQAQPEERDRVLKAWNENLQTKEVQIASQT
jgi:hypothetical protein